MLPFGMGWIDVNYNSLWHRYGNCLKTILWLHLSNEKSVSAKNGLVFTFKMVGIILVSLTFLFQVKEKENLA